VEVAVQYWVIYERVEGGGWSAYAPDLPGLGVAAATYEEVRRLIREGMALHLAGMRDDGEAWPAPREAWAELVDVPDSAVTEARTALTS
jgi:predicted RNase H-like HicB family nuclease